MSWDIWVEMDTGAGQTLARWKAQPSGFFDEMEPVHKCGSVRGTYRFWRNVQRLCADHPLATLRVDG